MAKIRGDRGHAALLHPTLYRNEDMIMVVEDWGDVSVVVKE